MFPKINQPKNVNLLWWLREKLKLIQDDTSETKQWFVLGRRQKRRSKQSRPWTVARVHGEKNRTCPSVTLRMWTFRPADLSLDSLVPKYFVKKILFLDFKSCVGFSLSKILFISWYERQHDYEIKNRRRPLGSLKPP